MARKVSSSELNSLQNWLHLFALDKHFDICRRSMKWTKLWHQYFKAVSLLHRGDQLSFLTYSSALRNVGMRKIPCTKHCITTVGFLLRHTLSKCVVNACTVKATMQKQQN